MIKISCSKENGTTMAMEGTGAEILNDAANILMHICETFDEHGSIGIVFREIATTILNDNPTQ